MLAVFSLFILPLTLLSSFGSIILGNASMDVLPVSIRLVDKRIRSLEEMVKAKKENDAVMITITTYAYRFFTVDFYYHNNMSRYSSFFVVTQDELTYHVCPVLLSSLLVLP